MNPQEPNQTQETKVEVPEAPKKQSNVFILLSTFLTLILLASTGYLYYQNMMLQKQLAALQPSPTPEATPDPTTSWKTYTNSYWGVSFKYPDNLFKPCVNYTTNEMDGVRFWGPNFGCPDGHDTFYKIGFIGYEPGKYVEYKKPTSTEMITINGVQALKKTYVYDESDGPLLGLKQSTEVVIKLDNGTIVLQQLGVNMEEQKAFDQILSTFKFIEPVACTMEAKLCPGGSSVGRSGPNCEFAPCPTP